MRTFTRFVVSCACLLVVGGHAAAESAREFWQNEWQRQRSRVSSSSWQERGTVQEQGERFGGQKPFGYSGVPEGQLPRFGKPHRDRGRMPAVRVSNPDFFTYVPDKLTNVAFDSVCEFKTAANAGAAKPQDSEASVPAAATPASDSSPAAAFVPL